MKITDAEILRHRIDARRSQAEMLLSLASQDTVKEQVRLGLRDLEEALAWVDRRPNTSPVHLLLELAAWRLNTVVQMLRTEGADVKMS